jgi:hypothetical protein
MRQVKRFVTSAAAIGVATASAAALGIGTEGAAAAPPLGRPSNGAAILALSPILKRCDFSDDTHVAAAGNATGFAVISSDGSKVTAEVHLLTAIPDIMYNVRLIEMPRPSGNRCNVGDGGTAVDWLYTDDGGNGSQTLRADVIPGATGAWVLVEGPSGGNSKILSGEFYSSDSVAPI